LIPARGRRRIRWPALLGLALLLQGCWDFPDSRLPADGSGSDDVNRDQAVDQAPDRGPDRGMDRGLDRGPDRDRGLDMAGDLDLDGPIDMLPDTGLVFRANGQSCLVDSDCWSNICADKICCDQPCTGTCQSCALSGKLGTCTPVPAGQAPTAPKACTVTAPGTCGLDGKCDGAGGCRRWPGGTICLAASCSGTGGEKVAAARICDGKGLCISPLATSGDTDCSPYACDSSTNRCFSSCSTPDSGVASGCKTGVPCSGGKCTGATGLPLGAPCSGSSVCAPASSSSSYCADGVCCESACTGTCETCALPGAEGRCVKVPFGQRPPTGKTCAITTACHYDGTCDGSGACRYALAGAPCQATSCSSGARRTYGCSGTKQAQCKLTNTNCGRYGCLTGTHGVGCYGNCETSAQCSGTNVCSGSKCVAP
jgi:hypothetical protein